MDLDADGAHRRLMTNPPGDGLHGAHRRAELVEQIGRRQVEQLLRDGTLRSLWPGFLIDSRRFLDPWTHCGAAQLLVESRGAACGSTAAALHGHDAFTSGTTHVIVPYYVRATDRPGLVLHRGSYFERDVVDVKGLRVLRRERMVSDVLCDARDGDGLALADQVLRAAGKDYEAVRKDIAGCLRRRADPRGTRKGAMLLDLASPAAESPAESRLRLRLVEQGFPLPEVNWKLIGMNGRLVFRLDLAWPQQRIAVEYDGVDAHTGREEHDAARDAELARRGWIVIRVRSADLVDLTRVDGELRAAFRTRGYVW